MHKVVLAIFLSVSPVALAQKPVQCVNKYVTNPHMTQHQFDAMTDFTYNVGCGAFRGSTLLKKFNAGDIAGAANEFMRWTYVGKVQVRGLIRRRTAERDLFLKP